MATITRRKTDFKICKNCKELKPLSEFYKMIYTVKTRRGKVRKTSFRPVCKVCKRQETKNRYNGKSQAEKTAIHRKSRLKYVYGITLDEYNALLEKQNFVCAICGEGQNIESHSLAVDHCHASGKVRGLLCHKCNVALGLMNDSTENLFNAVLYLRGVKC